MMLTQVLTNYSISFKLNNKTKVLLKSMFAKEGYKKMFSGGGL